MKSVDWKFIVSTGIAAVALVFAGLQLTQRPKDKSLSLRVDDVAPIKIDATLGLKLLLDDKLVSQPIVAVVTILNSGGVEIRQSEFERQLEIDVGDKAKLVKVINTHASPSTLRPAISNTDKRIALQPLLLNPGDEITLQVLLSGESPTFTANGRIAGIKTISISPAATPPPKGKLVFSAVIFFILGGVLLRIVWDDLPPKASHRLLKLNGPMSILILTGACGIIVSGITFAEASGLLEYLGFAAPKEISFGSVFYVISFLLVALLISWLVQRAVGARATRIDIPEHK